MITAGDANNDDFDVDDVFDVATGGDVNNGGGGGYFGGANDGEMLVMLGSGSPYRI